MMNHITKKLSRFIAELKYEDLPDDVVELTKLYIVDYYAACFAGLKINGIFNKAIEELLFENGGKEEAAVFFSDKKLPVGEAAFLNAVYAHGADMDDGNRKAMGHVAAHVMSAVFALAQTLEVSGRDVIVAIQAGYEVYNRVAAAAQPGLVHRGFHSTGTAGSIACGVAAAKLMGLNERQIYNAISLSAIQSSGLMIITESGQACKPINPANAARVGILSARLAEKGIESAVNPLESKKGWLHAMSDNADESAITDGLGTVFTMTESYLKPYPSCRHTHCGIDAALSVRKELGCVTEEMVDRIDVWIYGNAIRIAGQIEIPQCAEDSKFSIHYSLATALLKGHFDLNDLSAEGVTEEIRSLVGKIHLHEDASMENSKKGIRGARTVIRLKDGREFVREIPVPKGDAANPFTRTEMLEKLCACTQGVLSENQCKELFAAIDRIEQIDRFISVNATIPQSVKEKK